MIEYPYTAYYKTDFSNGLHNCQTKEEAINLLLEHKQTKKITPIAIIESSTNRIVWFNPDLGLEYCQNHIQNQFK